MKVNMSCGVRKKPIKGLIATCRSEKKEKNSDINVDADENVSLWHVNRRKRWKTIWPSLKK
jgi:hypothetical protein